MMPQTSTITAVISMLHEPPGRDSASRLFRSEPVLCWTLERLSRCTRLESLAVLCWEDQLPQVEPIASERGAYILAKGPRLEVPSVQAIAAARKWSDGWRGGLLQTCDFDLGFYAPWFKEIADKLDAGALLMIDPAAGLIDPQLVDRLLDHASLNDSVELIFSQAAPGLCPALLRVSLLDRLAAANLHPGKLLHYLPDQPVRDPIATEHCLSVPTPVARSLLRFKLDSDRQISRIQNATVSLNGQLIASPSEELVHRLDGSEAFDALPRDVVLELNTHRATRPLFQPGHPLNIQRPPMTLERAKRLFGQLGRLDDIRLTLAGVGDPLLHDQLFAIIAAARQAGLDAIHLETDLLPEQNLTLAQLAAAGPDVISFHLPATTPQTYAQLMGRDAFTQVLANVKAILGVRHEHQRGLPLLVPLFVKCRQNQAEMELWYDQWLRSLSCATILGPSDYAGLIPDCAAADMAPPRRRPCARLSSRLTILSDGHVVACEQDVTGRHPLGHIDRDSLSELWRIQFAQLRQAHSQQQWDSHPPCRACREWHRP